MMVLHMDEDNETNVEGITALLASQFPLEDPVACKTICQLLPVVIEALLTSRQNRQRDD